MTGPSVAKRTSGVSFSDGSPGSATVIQVPFGYPRDESVHEDPRFAHMRARIRTLVMEEYEAQARQAVRIAD